MSSCLTLRVSFIGPAEGGLLQIDDFVLTSAVAVEEYTWGAIKNLYRQ
jgi:hypothetical protein